MTKNNEEIIINDIDVSGCKNFSCGVCEEENKIPRTINHFTADCRMYPNCYYKQLKRKEQECERTKERLESFQKDYSKLYQVVENKGYIKELDQLKAENEKLKKQLESTKGLATVGNRQLAEALKGYEELKKCYKNNSAVLDFEETNTTKLVNKVIKLEKTLAEIKFWARELLKRTGQVVPYEIKQILQKIREVEDDN